MQFFKTSKSDKIQNFNTISEEINKDLWIEVLSFLDYKSLLNIAATSRFFINLINENEAKLMDRISQSFYNDYKLIYSQLFSENFKLDRATLKGMKKNLRFVENYDKAIQQREKTQTKCFETITSTLVLLVVAISLLIGFYVSQYIPIIKNNTLLSCLLLAATIFISIFIIPGFCMGIVKGYTSEYFREKQQLEENSPFKKIKGVDYGATVINIDDIEDEVNLNKRGLVLN